LKVLLVVMAVLVLALESWYFWTEREHALQASEISTANLARSLNQHAEDTFEMAGLALSGLVDAMDAQAPSSPASKQLIHEVMANEVAAAPRLRGLFIYDENGNWIASSLPATPSQMNNSDRAYFRHHRNSLSSDIFIGPPVRSRSSNEWIITVTRRYDKLDGSFGGVVLASLPVSYFANFYKAFDVGREGAIVLLNADGTLYARQPFNENIVGTSLASTPLFLDHLSKAPSGAYRYVSTIDDIRRVSGYQLGKRYPLVVVAALGENEVLAEWWQNVLTRGSTAAIFVGLLVLMGFRLAKQVARRQEVEADLERLASTDALTGLSNRRAFDKALEKEWARASREGTTLSLILIDVDHFKQFNDRYGHQAGDAALQVVAAECARACRRPGDVAARYGGEELALILPNTDAAGASIVAEGARRAIEGLELSHQDSATGSVTASFGCASRRPPADDHAQPAGSLTKLADAALYEAKMKGRNRVIAAGGSRTTGPKLVVAARA
jgi:diguanylate cyclase (GGDEF)-like protein